MICLVLSPSVFHLQVKCLKRHTYAPPSPRRGGGPLPIALASGKDGGPRRRSRIRLSLSRIQPDRRALMTI